MLTHQTVPETLDTPMKGMPKLRGAGIGITLVALLIAAHAGVQFVELFAGRPINIPLSVLYVESGLAMVLGMTGFGLLVAGAEPFDEVDQAPMLKYEDETRDPFE